MRCHHRIWGLEVVNQHLVGYPTPINLNCCFHWSSLLGILLMSQMVTGILLAMHYVPHVHFAFASVQHLMTDVPSGMILRYAHANGASLFFMMMYMHILRGIYYSSGNQTREMVWVTGVLILLAMIVTAFIGYVLPWGQMSFQGAAMIWLWGGFSVDIPTLNRFYSKDLGPEVKRAHVFADGGMLRWNSTAYGGFMVTDENGVVLTEGIVEEPAQKGSAVDKIDIAAVRAGFAWAALHGFVVSDVWFNGLTIQSFVRENHPGVVRHKGTAASTFVGIEICDTQVRIAKVLAQPAPHRTKLLFTRLAEYRGLSPFCAIVPPNK